MQIEATLTNSQFLLNRAGLRSVGMDSAHTCVTACYPAAARLVPRWMEEDTGARETNPVPLLPSPQVHDQR